MTVCAVKGLGATLACGSGSGGQTIGSVTSIEGPSMTVGTVECTSLSSDYKSYLSTLPDGGELSFTVNWDASDSGQQAALSLIDSPSDTQDWLLTLSDNSTVGFVGILTGFAIKGIEPEGIVTADCTIKVNGEVNFT